MLKNNELSFSLLQRLVDFIVVIFCWTLAYFIRFESIIPGAQQGLEGTFIKLAPIISIITLYTFNKHGLYLSQRFSSRIKEISTVMKANFYSFLAFIIVLYFFSENRVSRLMLANYLALSQILLVTVRISVRNLLRYLRKKGLNLRHILLVGDGKQLEDYVNTAKKFKDSGIRFIGWIESNCKSSHHKIPELDISLAQAKDQYQPDGIVFGFSSHKAQELDKHLDEVYNDLIPVQILPDLKNTFIGFEISSFAGVPIIQINKAKLSLMDHVIKRSFDFFGAFFGLIILSPIMLIIAILVKISSKGPIFYGQERMGLDGKSFQMWKFRSMKVDAENISGAVWAQENDPRRTKIGTFLRSTSLDELPQLWNVLIGEMSLVGPRPERPVFVNEFKHNIPAYMLRHKMKAGITGWAQVNGWRGNTSLEKRIECDIEYIKNWSLWFDIKILFLTFSKGFINKNAY